MRLRESQGIRPIRLTAALLVLLLASSCGGVPNLPSGGPCPAGWQAAVLFSTWGGWYSQLAYVTDDGRIERQNLPYTDVGVAPAPMGRSDDKIALTAAGTPVIGRGRLITISTTTCGVTGQDVDEVGVWSIAGKGGDLYTTNTINGAAAIRRRGPDRSVAAETTVPASILTSLAVRDDTLYALGEGLDDSVPMLLTLDAQSLSERSRIGLRGDYTPSSAVIKDNDLYYPETLFKHREGSRLRMIDLDTLEQTSVDLGSPAPSQIIDGGDQLYIAHRFVNPGFRPDSEYRWVSRYDPASGTVELFDLGTAIKTIAIKDQTLYALGDSDDQELAFLRAFELPAMTLRSEVVIPRPTGPGHYYVSAIILP